MDCTLNTPNNSSIVKKLAIPVEFEEYSIMNFPSQQYINSNNPELPFTVHNWMHKLENQIFLGDKYIDISNIHDEK